LPNRFPEHHFEFIDQSEVKGQGLDVSFFQALGAHVTDEEGDAWGGTSSPSPLYITLDRICPKIGLDSYANDRASRARSILRSSIFSPARRWYCRVSPS
jgi:hypothetical protein